MRAIHSGRGRLLASTSLAFADDIMAGLYGNTIVSKSTMGEVHAHYKADHTFDGTASSAMGSMDLKGTWVLDDKGQLCRTYDTPPPGVTNPLCTRLGRTQSRRQLDVGRPRDYARVGNSVTVAGRGNSAMDVLTSMALTSPNCIGTRYVAQGYPSPGI